MKKKVCLIIIGPTAAGKTALAVWLAKELNTDIISADSRQCFRELNIGVAKPSPQQLKEVKHYFINSHSIQEEVNAASFEEYALHAAAEIFTSHNQAIMVGGSGLYIRAFCKGLDPIPVVPAAIREWVNHGYLQSGLAWLQQTVKQHDPDYYATGEVMNPHRLMRSLEVKISTGNSILSYQSQHESNRGFIIRKIGLQLPREILYRNIDDRVDSMILNGLLEEVKELLPERSSKALNTVGYKEIFEYLDGKISLEKTVEDIKTNTRHYAKRQLTWFKKEEGVRWFKPDEYQEIKNYLVNAQDS